MIIEIKWLCEFLEIPYRSEKSIDIWMTTICDYIKRDFNIVYFNNYSTVEQLTIFDYE